MNSGNQFKGKTAKEWYEDSLKWRRKFYETYTRNTWLRQKLKDLRKEVKKGV